MSEHTAGPWRMRVSTDDQGGDTTDIVASAKGNCNVCSDVDVDADAALIAAAPEMFAALDNIAHDHACQAQVRAAVASDDYRKGCDAGLNWAQDIARVAIRGATTEQPNGGE